MPRDLRGERRALPALARAAPPRGPVHSRGIGPIRPNAEPAERPPRRRAPMDLWRRGVGPLDHAVETRRPALRQGHPAGTRSQHPRTPGRRSRRSTTSLASTRYWQRRHTQSGGAAGRETTTDRATWTSPHPNHGPGHEGETWTEDGGEWDGARRSSVHPPGPKRVGCRSTSNRSTRLPRPSCRPRSLPPLRTRRCRRQCSGSIPLERPPPWRRAHRGPRRHPRPRARWRERRGRSTPRRAAFHLRRTS